MTPPVWRVHRHIGVGGDQLVARVAGDQVEERLGDAIRESETRLYGELIGEVIPFEGARELIVELRERGHPPVLASSAKREETEHYVELLDAGELIEDYTTAADVERTKPEPDLVATAMLTGGSSAAELRAAGAVDVFESLVELRERLDATPLR